MALCLAAGTTSVTGGTAYAYKAEINLAAISNGASGSGYSVSGNRISFTAAGSYRVYGTTDVYRLYVNALNVAITLDGASVTRTDAAAFFSMSRNTTLTLSGANTLEGVNAIGTVDGEITISGGGSLTATGVSGVPIGAKINIAGGTVTVGGEGVISAGGTAVGGDVTVSGTAADITINGNIGSGSLTVSGGTAAVTGSVDGDLTVSGGAATVTGTVAGTTKVTGGTVSVNGQNVTPSGGAEIDLEAISSGDAGPGYSVDSDTITFNLPGSYRVYGTTDVFRLYVNAANVAITLHNASVTITGAPALFSDYGDTTLTLSGANTLEGASAIGIADCGEITISGGGSLTATGVSDVPIGAKINIAGGDVFASEPIILSADRDELRAETRLAKPGRDLACEELAEKLMRSLAKAYPEKITAVEYRAGDWAVSIGEKWYYCAEFRLLPEELLPKKESYAPQSFYEYFPDLPEWKAYEGEDIEKMKNALKKKPKRDSSFFDTIWDAHTQKQARGNLVNISFLGKRVQVHKVLAGRLAKVEARIAEAAKTDPEVRGWINEIGSVTSWNWRNIKGAAGRSFHAYAVALDIQPKNYKGLHTYWRWSAVFEDKWYNVPYSRRWHPPDSVIMAFEAYGFCWGGKWALFDTMHFEYRPEIMLMFDIKI
jgi:hypothetical protein